LSIDWLTVAAQIVNFLILVWLLRRFLYGPITRAMEAREQHIQARLEEADETRKLAEMRARELAAERDGLAGERERFLAHARSEADRLRHTLEQEVRAEMEARRDAWRRDIEGDQQRFVAELRGRMIEQFYAFTRDALGGLASKSLNDAIGASFADRLGRFDGDALERLREAARRADTPIVVESSFPLDAALKRRITASVHEMLRGEAQITYRQGDDLICGIRLLAGGQALAWSLDHYLDRLEQHTREALAEETMRSVEDASGRHSAGQAAAGQATTGQHAPGAS